MFSKLKNKQEFNKENNLVKKIDGIFTDFLINQPIQELGNIDREMNYYTSISKVSKSDLLNAVADLELRKLLLLEKRYKKSSVNVDQNVKNNTLTNLKNKKEEVATHLSDYYVKLYEIFNTIMTTLDPIYSYKDEKNNKKVEFRLSQYKQHLHEIKNKKVTLVKKYSNSSIIDQRLSILTSAFDNSGNPKIDIDAICKIYKSI